MNACTTDSEIVRRRNLAHDNKRRDARNWQVGDVGCVNHLGLQLNPNA
jgi:hypothetical protein